MRANSSVALALGLAALAATLPSQGQRRGRGEYGYVRQPDEPPVQSFEQELPYYKRRIHAKSLHLRARARDRIADTKDPRALQLLMDGYAKPEAPKAFVQYMCASLAARYFQDLQFVDTLASWRNQHRRNQDAWLWYRTLAVHQDRKDASELVRIATADGKLFLRAAAIHAVGTGIDTAALPLIDTILDELPRDKVERAVLVEALAALMWGQRHRLGEKAFQNPVARVIHQLNAKETLYRTKLTIARHLMRLFDSDDLIIEADPWLRRLADNTGPDDQYKDLYARPSFMGVKGTGKLIGYVIDMSDSMLTPVKVPEEKKRPTTPITGTKPGKKKKKTVEEEIPWHVVKNRFDVAREYLKVSLKGLDKDMQFCVIFFGSKAAPLKATPGLVPVTPGNVKKAIRELDGIHPGPKKNDRPYGTLRGFTNLHGGIHRAFKARKKKLVGDDEYVDKKAFLEGCDTIFILSDGDPTWCDWPNPDPPDKWDEVGDPESRTPGRGGDKLIYHGPYDDWRYLVDDVRRLNLFRKAELHCIGIGEASQRLLNRIARQGFGKVKMVSGL
ncbi:MAG: vWA domain-containing protein [Planctomycetota bacterium]|jgi:hypothetical protein